MNSSRPDERTTPETAPGTPPVERRFARRIDCAPRVNAVMPPPQPPGGPAPATPHPASRP